MPAFEEELYLLMLMSTKDSDSDFNEKNPGFELSLLPLEPLVSPQAKSKSSLLHTKSFTSSSPAKINSIHGKDVVMTLSPSSNDCFLVQDVAMTLLPPLNDRFTAQVPALQQTIHDDIAIAGGSDATSICTGTGTGTSRISGSANLKHTAKGHGQRVRGKLIATPAEAKLLHSFFQQGMTNFSSQTKVLRERAHSELGFGATRLQRGIRNERRKHTRQEIVTIESKFNIEFNLAQADFDEKMPLIQQFYDYLRSPETQASCQLKSKTLETYSQAVEIYDILTLFPSLVGISNLKFTKNLNLADTVVTAG